MIHADERLELKFYDELLPDGTAGCIRDAADEQSEELMIILPASITCPPEIAPLISEHNKGGGHLTVMLNPCPEKDVCVEQASGIYLCNSSILRHIPPVGYFDIKEGLIPEVLSAGKSVHAAKLRYDPGHFRHSRGYLRAVARYLEMAPDHRGDLPSCKKVGSQDVWIAANAKVESDARIYGPVVIMDGATVAAGAVVLGPAVVESNATISEDAVIAGSVLWTGARVGPNCRIERSVIDHDAIVRGGSVVHARTVTRASKRGLGLIAICAGVLPLLTLSSLIGGMLRSVRDRANSLKDTLQSSSGRASQKLPVWARLDRRLLLIFAALTLVLISFIWSYGPGLADLWRLWNESDEYSSGLLVPFLAVYVLWSRRRDIFQCSFRPSAWGLLAFVLAQAVRFLGLFLWYGSAERFSMVLTIAALTLLLAGTQFFRKVSPILLFLCLMLPWPNLIQDYIGLRLQGYATSSAVFCLEVIGYEIVPEGNVIHIGDVSVAVAEACNGLRMITAFFVISGLVVLLVKRAWWEKLIVLVSSLPIALVCNTVRLVVTAIFFTVLKGEYWEDIFHDFGGYAMMPLALAAVVGELWLLTKLTTLPVDEEAIIITRQSG
jgi:exosortase